MKRKNTLIISLIILSLVVGATSVYGAGVDLLWGKTITVVPPYQTISGAVLLSSSLCILYGKYYFVSGDPLQSTGYLKVYDISTGNLLWERSQQISDHIINSYSLLLDGNILYISDNYAYNTTPTTIPSTSYGAYDAFNGQPIWEKTNSGNTSFAKVTKEPLADNKLFAISQDNTRTSVNIRVYQASNIISSAINILMLDK